MRLIESAFRGRQTRIRADDARSPDPRLPLSLSLLGLTVLVASASAQESPRTEQLFERLDSNGDSVVDEQELTAARRAAFERADADRDGHVDGEELAELANELQVAGGGPRRPMRGRLAQRPGGTERLQRMDVDRDGRISETEFVAAPSALLRFDRDGDGRITRAELDAGQAHAQSRGVERRARRL